MTVGGEREDKSQRYRHDDELYHEMSLSTYTPLLGTILRVPLPDAYMPPLTGGRGSRGHLCDRDFGYPLSRPASCPS